MNTFLTRFLIRVLLLGITTALSLITLQVLLPERQDDYLQAYNQKCRLLETIPSPRIIFIGGSNLAFSLDSHRIQDSLHLPVINYGLHAGIGLKYMVDDIATYAQKGDILVFAPEYSHFYGAMYGESVAITGLLAASHWKKLHLLNIRQIINVICGLPHHISVKLLPSIPNERTYSASNFNEYGDEAKHWELSSMPYIKTNSIKGTFDSEFGNYFVSQIRNLQQKCQVYLIPPVYRESNFKLNREKVKKVADFLQEAQCPYLVTPVRHVLPDSCAYDTEYHMNRSGVDIYTSRIIEELKQAIRIPAQTQEPDFPIKVLHTPMQNSDACTPLTGTVSSSIQWICDCSPENANGRRWE